MRPLAATRLLYGSALVLAPGTIVRALPHGPIDRRTRLVGRVLGVRQVLQATVVERRPTKRRLLVGAALDAGHAATMLLLAERRPRRRRLARANALAALTFATAGLLASRRAPHLR